MLFEKGVIVIIKNGRYTGHKAVVTSVNEDRVRVIGVSKVPRPVTEEMTERAKARRNKMHVFVKDMNPKHLIFTRYTTEIDVNVDCEKKEARANVMELYKKFISEGSNKWLLTKLKI